MDPHVLTDQGIRDPTRNPLEGRALQDDRVLDLTPFDAAARTNGGVGPDERAADLGAGADDRRTADRTGEDPRARFDHDLSLDTRPRVDPIERTRRERVEDDAVRLEHVFDFPRVLPPARDEVRVDTLAVIDEPLDRVGDFEFLPGARSDRTDGFPDGVVEHVNADERQV